MWGGSPVQSAARRPTVEMVEMMSGYMLSQAAAGGFAVAVENISFDSPEDKLAMLEGVLRCAAIWDMKRDWKFEEPHTSKEVEEAEKDGI